MCRLIQTQQNYKSQNPSKKTSMQLKKKNFLSTADKKPCITKHIPIHLNIVLRIPEQVTLAKCEKNSAQNKMAAGDFHFILAHFEKYQTNGSCLLYEINRYFQCLVQYFMPQNCVRNIKWFYLFHFFGWSWKKQSDQKSFAAFV